MNGPGSQLQKTRFKLRRSNFKHTVVSSHFITLCRKSGLKLSFLWDKPMIFSLVSKNSGSEGVKERCQSVWHTVGGRLHGYRTVIVQHDFLPQTVALKEKPANRAPDVPFPFPELYPEHSYRVPPDCLSPVGRSLQDTCSSGHYKAVKLSQGSCYPPEQIFLPKWNNCSRQAWRQVHRWLLVSREPV